VLALREAEAKFIDMLIEGIRSGTLHGLDLWRRLHEGGELPEEVKNWASAEPKPLQIEESE
jgi:hypothetical protein